MKENYGLLLRIIQQSQWKGSDILSIINFGTLSIIKF